MVAISLSKCQLTFESEEIDERVLFLEVDYSYKVFIFFFFKYKYNILLGPEQPRRGVRW